MAPSPERYCGRFAPTPSGPLHLGSLVTAVASWLDARQHEGQWLLRIDDIDPPREQPGAADEIQRQLNAFGLHWDGDTLFQSHHHDRYRQAIEQLLAADLAFHCSMSRTQLANMGNHHPGPVAAVSASEDTAVRLAVPDEETCFDDALYGRCCLNLESAGGAFVIRRRDGLYAYQLACAVDDCYPDITHVLRGDDLLDSTFRQLHVLTCLDKQAPRYAHLPVIKDAKGNKLSKSAGSAALDMTAPHRDMHRALTYLGISVAANAPPSEQLAQALPQWRSPFGAGEPEQLPLT